MFFYYGIIKLGSFGKKNIGKKYFYLIGLVFHIHHRDAILPNG